MPSALRPPPSTAADKSALMAAPRRCLVNRRVRRCPELPTTMSGPGLVASITLSRGPRPSPPSCFQLRHLSHHLCDTVGMTLGKGGRDPEFLNGPGASQNGACTVWRLASGVGFGAEKRQSRKRGFDARHGWREDLQRTFSPERTLRKTWLTSWKRRYRHGCQDARYPLVSTTQCHQ